MTRDLFFDHRAARVHPVLRLLTNDTSDDVLRYEAGQLAIAAWLQRDGRLPDLHEQAIELVETLGREGIPVTDIPRLTVVRDRAPAIAHVPIANSTERAIVNAADLALVRGRTWHLVQIRNGRGDKYPMVKCTEWDGEKRRSISMSRIVLGAQGKERVVNISGDPLDNRRANLRLVDKCEDEWMRGKRPGSSRFKGVAWIALFQRWRSRIQVRGEVQNLGFFEREEDAARAYDAAVRQLRGGLAAVNFPNEGERSALQGDPSESSLR